MGDQQSPTRKEREMINERQRENGQKKKEGRDGERLRQKKYKRRQLCSFHSDEETHNRGQECKERDGERKKMCKHEREEEREGKKKRRGQGAVMTGNKRGESRRVTGCVQICKISLRGEGKNGGDT